MQNGSTRPPRVDTPWPVQPVTLQVNTAVWLAELASQHGSPLTLAEVPAAVWDDLVAPGIDLVWLLGVWQRSLAGRDIALADPAKLTEIGTALPDWTAADVAGSPFSIRDYVPEPAFGGWDGLRAARAELAARGVRLMLDWVPNHMGPDSPWLTSHPQAFMPGTPDELRDRPDEFLAVGDSVFARGRDPYFPPWPDVVQVNPFSPVLRELAGRTLAEIAAHCDAVRADMAMLMLDDVVTSVWGQRAGAVPASDYWHDIMAAVRSTNPDLRYVAEVYWGREPQLQELGFQYCYDKTLLDLLEAVPARADVPAAAAHEALAAHLGADPAYQAGLVRFIENHDEARAATAIEPWERRQAASVIIATLPGMTLWHEGQAEGRRVWLPVFLARRPVELADPVSREFHHWLWALGHRVRGGDWRLLGTADDRRCGRLAWSWTDGRTARVWVVAVNYSAAPGNWQLELGPVGGLQPLAEGGPGWELAGNRLTLSLVPWGFLILAGDASSQ